MNIRMKNENQAEVSKSFMRKASIYGTEEYRLWRAFLAENPGYTMVAKEVKNSKSAQKKNATYENMEAYIRLQEDSEKKLAEFENIKKASKIQRNPYGNVLAWFDATYPNARAQFKAEDEANSETKAA